MASDGDTITYTANGSTQSEDISNISVAVVEYCEGGGGTTGPGGKVENAMIDVGSESTLYIWVGEAYNNDGNDVYGRYIGEFESFKDEAGGGSSEISFTGSTGRGRDGNRTAPDGTAEDAPFLVGSGGGAVAGGRGGSGSQYYQQNPPQGGGPVDDASGSIDDQNRGLVTGATTTANGANNQNSDGEIKISYYQVLPSSPSDLIAEVTG